MFRADPARALATLQTIKNLGVKLVLDDFGTGYFSLSYLRQFPVDVLKLDRSFTAHVAKDKVTPAIVTTIIDLSHVLDLTVTAEGVESAVDSIRSAHWARTTPKVFISAGP